MTGQEPHQFRCGTCKFSKLRPDEWLPICEISGVHVTTYLNDRISEIGCASHSTAQTEREKQWTEEEVIKEISCAFDRGYKACLDEMPERMIKRGFGSTSVFIQALEELRQGEQERDQ